VQIKIGRRKVKKHARLAQRHGFGPTFLHSFLLKVGKKKHGKAQYLPKKSVINMISLLLPVGLLLVVSHLFAPCSTSFSIMSGVGKN